MDEIKSSFIMRSVRQWNRLPRVVVPSPSLEAFKTQLDKTLSNLVVIFISARAKKEDGSGYTEE